MEGATARPAGAWLKDYLSPLVGCTITGVDALVEDGEAWPRIKVRLPEGHLIDGTNQIELEVSRDEEGNGPGFLFGLPIPTLEEAPDGA
jgi:hypothetical protein